MDRVASSSTSSSSRQWSMAGHGRRQLAERCAYLKKVICQMKSSCLACLPPGLDACGKTRDAALGGALHKAPHSSPVGRVAVPRARWWRTRTSRPRPLLVAPPAPPCHPRSPTSQLMAARRATVDPRSSHDRVLRRSMSSIV